MTNGGEVSATRGLIEERLVDLDEERQRLERALSELSGKAPSRRGPGRPHGGSSAAGKPKRRPPGRPIGSTA
jgi:hypothetical protein